MVQTEQTPEQSPAINFNPTAHNPDWKWSEVDWFRAETVVRLLQERIYCATENQQ